MTKASATRRITDGDTPAATPFNLPLTAFTAGNGEALEAWTEMNRSLFARYNDMQREAVDFLTRRFEDDVKWQGELVASRSPAEAAEIMAAHIKTMIADYTEEARRLTGIAGDVQTACADFGSVVTRAAAQTTPANPAG